MICWPNHINFLCYEFLSRCVFLFSVNVVPIYSSYVWKIASFTYIVLIFRRVYLQLDIIIIIKKVNFTKPY